MLNQNRITSKIAGQQKAANGGEIEDCHAAGQPRNVREYSRESNTVVNRSKSKNIKSLSGNPRETVVVYFEILNELSISV